MSSYLRDRLAFTILFFCPLLWCVGLNFDWQDAILSWVASNVSPLSEQQLVDLQIFRAVQLTSQPL